MSNGNFSVSRLLLWSGCIVFDIAAAVAFFLLFAPFSLLEPLKSVLVLMVIFVGIVISNGAVLYGDALFKKFGVAYATAIVSISIMYAVIANILSFHLIHTTSSAWYIVWELAVFAGLLGLYAIIAFFSQGAGEVMHKAETEQKAKLSIAAQLMDIEAVMMSQAQDDRLQPVITAFKQLKERINASTPFGRITDNSAVLDVENTIRTNLVCLCSRIQTNLTEGNIEDIRELLDHTQRLVINRERLNMQ